MQIKKDKKIGINIKTAFVEMGSLIDAETGEAVDLTKVIEKVFGDNEVKISISSSTSEEVELPESEDSEE